MNALLERWAENPIIDELIFWPPKNKAIKSVRASAPMFRRPFIEIEFEDGKGFHRQFVRNSFAEFWAEAMIVLQTGTSIQVVSDFDCPPPADAETLRQAVLTAREECIEECEPMYAEGLYLQYWMQFGPDCGELPEEVRKKVEHARSEAGPAAAGT